MGFLASGNGLYLSVLHLVLAILSILLTHEPVAMDATQLFCASGSIQNAPTPAVRSGQVE